MLRFFSSGGLGDILIVCNKLTQVHNQDGEHILLKVYEKHACHKSGIQEVISCFPFITGTVELSDHAFETANNEASKSGAIYINTRTDDKDFQMSPLISPITKYNISPIEEKYICICYASGRMGDKSKRIVHPKVFQAIKTFLPEYKIVLVGPEYVELDENIISDEYNKTGRTKSVADAMGYINGADGFIGQDGVLSYYALMIGKPTIINWHDSSLPSHYWHQGWKNHGISIFQDNAIRWLTELELHAFRSMIRNGK